VNIWLNIVKPKPYCLLRCKTKKNPCLIIIQKKPKTIQYQSNKWLMYCFGEIPVWLLKNREKLLGV